MFKKFFKNVKEKVVKSKGTQKVVGLVMSAVALLSLGTMCFASEGQTGTGQQGFVSAITTGLSADAIWGTITPIASVIIIVTLVALGRRILNKNLSAAKSGKSGQS